MTIVRIFLQGGHPDRSVATILEARLSHTIPTLAGDKIHSFVNPHPSYNGGGCVTPYYSYVCGASQTLTIPTLAGHKNTFTKERILLLKYRA
jgi:hypothetical protein